MGAATHPLGLVVGFYFGEERPKPLRKRAKRPHKDPKTRSDRRQTTGTWWILESKGELKIEAMKVSSKSSPKSVAGAIAGVLREQGTAEVQAIGAGALNQAVKAIAIARGFVAPSGLNLMFVPAFIDVQIDGEERTAIKLLIEIRKSAADK